MRFNIEKLAKFWQKSELSWQIFESIPSTNQKLWEMIEEGVKLPIVAIACEQTGGKGQWGRVWQSTPGGLYLSLGLPTDLLATNAPHITIFSAWGIVTSLNKHNIPVLIKWPNDILLNRKKLGGILSETRVQQGKITHLVIGVGINWVNSVPETGINLQSFPEINSLEMLAEITLNGILSGYEYYLAKGIETLVESYQKLLDKPNITVNGCPGIVKGITAAGELRVCLYSVGAKTEITLPPGTISIGYC
ncbi:MAG: biotin--[Gomphosphaeria aponina SAG 52.96 = DSM 107014]|uniref:Biotin--[acetyl-CoA-carboxylase] ligase n=1 Tax=Gomphosphaeria aponina SAG 52.96 = DSM 107014 TaxID=1521640 RepID=A0A941GUG3_9CHRO|nr:biotin--[acetyl-CoA-carboxylase] ligase [Gomphosphaeria aponina SAG 52.96 = DSM 107014]